MIYRERRLTVVYRMPTRRDVPLDRAAILVPDFEVGIMALPARGSVAVFDVEVCTGARVQRVSVVRRGALFEVVHGRHGRSG